MNDHKFFINQELRIEWKYHKKKNNLPNISSSGNLWKRDTSKIIVGLKGFKIYDQDLVLEYRSDEETL